MKRITKKIVCLLTVATMLLVATVTVVGAVQLLILLLTIKKTLSKAIALTKQQVT